MCWFYRKLYWVLKGDRNLLHVNNKKIILQLIRTVTLILFTLLVNRYLLITIILDSNKKRKTQTNYIAYLNINA